MAGTMMEFGSLETERACARSLRGRLPGTLVDGDAPGLLQSDEPAAA